MMSARSFKPLLWFVRGIAITAFALSLALWVFCQEDRFVWSRTFDLQITVKYGDIEWLSRHHYFGYNPGQPLAASFVVLIALCFYRYLRTTLGLVLLAILVNFVVMSTENYLSNRCSFYSTLGWSSW